MTKKKRSTATKKCKKQSTATKECKKQPLSLKDYVAIAGGGTYVARIVGVTRKSVWAWTHYGLPHTEWSGATNYAVQLATLCGKNGFHVTAETILGEKR